MAADPEENDDEKVVEGSFLLSEEVAAGSC